MTKLMTMMKKVKFFWDRTPQQECTQWIFKYNWWLKFTVINLFVVFLQIIQILNFWMNLYWQEICAYILNFEWNKIREMWNYLGNRLTWNF